MEFVIRNESKAGCRVWLGDGLVRFDDAGYAVGVVKRDGQPLDPPGEINPSQIDHARRAEEFGYVVEEAGAEEAVAEASEPPQEDAEVADEVEAPGEGSDAEEAAVGAEGVPSDEEAEPAEPDVPDVDAMSRGELWELTQELDLDLGWTGSTNEEFKEAIRAHYGVSEPAEA